MEFNNRKIIYIIISVAIFLAGLSTAVYSLIRNGIFADSSQGYYDQIKLTENVDSNDKKELININVSKNGNAFSFVLEVKNGRKLLSTINLSGFENIIGYCETPILNLSDGKKAICVSGYVGAHSENLQIVKFDGKLTLIPFNQGESPIKNMVTDAPYYTLNNNNGIFEGIEIDSRNYDKDPVVDIIRSHYYLVRDELILQNREEIKMPSALEESGSGQIN